LIVSADLFLSFRNEQSAFRFVEACLWRDGPTCPHCGATKRIGKLRGESTRTGTYKCYHCRKLFNVRSGTIFELSHVPLHKWLQAIYLCECGTKPLKPQQLSTILGVSFKTAGFIIRRMTAAAINSGVLGCTFESTPLSRDANPSAECKDRAAV
jgi:transposase-like protein